MLLIDKDLCDKESLIIKFIFNLFRITLISIIITQIFCECPNPDVLKPCHCEELYERITCDGTHTTDLKAILHKISPTLKTGQNHFQQLDLINTGIKELQEFRRHNI